MAKVTRRAFAAMASVAPMVFVSRVSDTTELYFDSDQWSGVARGTFRAEVVLWDGFIPRRGQRVKFQSPPIESDGYVTETRAVSEVGSIQWAEVFGVCEVTPKQFHGAYGPTSSRVDVDGKDCSRFFTLFEIREAKG